jgi:hypothetical protein
MTDLDLKTASVSDIGSKLVDLTEEPEAILAVVRAFCEEKGIAESTFGRLAVNDGKFVGRIASGSRIEPETAERVDVFMEKANKGEIRLRGRPRRKKTESNAFKMAELISQETSIRTPGSFAIHEQRHRFHVFAATTNESWVHADIMAEDLRVMTPEPDGFRIFYSPMDNGITLVRVLRALHVFHPDVPVQVVIKGWGLEDLRNTISRMVDRLIEHPLTVFVLTNLYTREAVQLKKTSDEGPQNLIWTDFALAGDRGYDYQLQVGQLFKDLAQQWTVVQGKDDLPEYAQPSVVCVYRADKAEALKNLIPQENGDPLEFDYCFLNHPFLHSHTMKFRTEYVLKPVIEHLAVGGMVKVAQSYGEDPAHEIIHRIADGKALPCVSRHDIISDLKKSLGEDQRHVSFSGLTDATSLYRFDMHTLPIIADGDAGALSLSLQSAWNNAVYFGQFKEELAQAMQREGTRYLDVTRDVLRERGGLWFVNETFAITRKEEGTA